MLEFAPLPLTIKPKRTSPKRTPEDKKLTNERLQLELAKELAAISGETRTHFPPTQKGNSKNPNAALMFDLVDSHFLNREAHEVAKAIQEGWRRKPWKGFVWYGRIHEPNGKPERVWLAPSMDLEWTGVEWEPYESQHAIDKTPGMPALSNVPVELTDALQRAIKKGKSGGIAEVELNATYVDYLADPTVQRDSLFITLSAFIRSAKRAKQINEKYGDKAEIYMSLEDIFSEFAINLMHRIEKNQYTHIGMMQNWIHYIWERYFFPEIQTKMNAYIDRSTYVNSLDPDLEGYEEQNHSVSLFKIEDEQAQREQEGYHAPVSRDRIFRQMNKPTQAIVQMLAEGLTQDEVAVNLKISTRQLRRRMDKAIEEGEALHGVLTGVVHSVRGCAEQGNILPWPSDETFDIQACAAESTLAETIANREKAWKLEELATLLNCSKGKLYKMVHSGRIPHMKVGGSMIRFDPKTTGTWIESKTA
jgi:excisionase family DNA binding protein